MKKHKTIVFSSILIVLAFLICIIHNASNQSIRLKIDQENISRVEVSCRGLAPVTLQYSEHKPVLDALFEQLSGNYHSTGIWNRGHTDGGGPYTILLKDAAGNTSTEIMYMNGQIVVSTIWKNIYRTYVPDHNTYLDFTDFYAYLDSIGAK